MRNSSKEQRSSVANKIIHTKTRITHLRNKEPVANMKLLLLLLLAGACQTYTPMKLGEIPKSETPSLQKLSFARGTKYYSCKGDFNRRKNGQNIDNDQKFTY